jgi:hypothetical protein
MTTILEFCQEKYYREDNNETLQNLKKECVHNLKGNCK